MLVKFFGNRGSIPTPGLQYSEYGGNTSCIQVVDKDTNHFVILDAGTGMKKLSDDILASKAKEGVVLLSHFHWDHIMGIPFFKPFYVPHFKFVIYGPKSTKEEMYNIMNDILAHDYFPVNFENFKANISFDGFDEYKEIDFHNFHISSLWSNHPCYTLSYKIQLGDKVLVYLTDHEPYMQRLHKVHPQLANYRNNAALLQARLIDYINGAHVLIIDAEYTKQEYNNRFKGWGHSSINEALQLALSARVKQVVIHHHNQERTDVQLNIMQEQVGDLLKNLNVDLKCIYAKEGSSIEI